MQKYNAKETALIVVDLQNYFIEEGSPLEFPEVREKLPQINQMITDMKEKGSLIIYTRVKHDLMNHNYYRELFPEHFDASGEAILKAGSHELEIYPGVVDIADYVVDKDRWSAFYETNLDLILKNHSIKNVVIAGLSTNVCCESTARDASFRDYNVLFLSDGNFATEPAMHEATLRTIELAFGKVMTMEELVASL